MRLATFRRFDDETTATDAPKQPLILGSDSDSRKRNAMSDATIYDEPTEVDAEEGVVILKGPDAVDVRMTPDAAEETSERLNTGAMKARGQRYFDSRE